MEAERGGHHAVSPWRQAGATLLGDVGLVLHLTTLMAAVTVPVAVLAGDRWAVVPLATTGVAAAVVGQGLHRRFGQAERRTPRTALAVVATGWIVTGGLGALLLWWMAAAAGPAGGPGLAVYRDPANALFEGVSGITSTGLSMAAGLESSLPATVQWWRSFSQWIGAVGVVVFTLALTSTGASGALLYEAAARPEMLSDDARTTARRIWTVYLGLTVIAIAALRAAGLDWWTSLNHGLSGIGTGGFTITDASFAEHPPAARYVGAGIIVTGAISFTVHYQLLSHRAWKAVLRRTQVRALAAGLLVGTPLLGLVLAAEARSVAAVDVVFQWTTALATAGFSSVDLSSWGPAALLLLIGAMVVGGASGSTAGGLKLSRVAWLAKALMTRLRAAEPGGAGAGHRWDGEPVGSELSRRAETHAGGMAVAWMLTLGTATILLLLLEPTAPTHRALFDATSALSNVGLDTGVITRDVGGATKVMFVALMVLGRLEIIGLLVLARSMVVHGADRGPPAPSEAPPAGA